MPSRILFALLSASTVLAAQQAAPICQQVTLPITISATPNIINLSPPKNQSELTGLLTSLTSLTSNVTSSLVGGPTNLTATYKIWTLLCLPPAPTNVTTVEFAVHGINFDHSYWNFGGKGSQYNYVDVAIRAGHGIFLYDRLGVGQSSKPDGIKEVQLATEVEVAAQLVSYLKSGKSGHKFTKFIGIGHSLGSLHLIGLLAKFGNIFDATVLTGISTFGGGQLTAVASLGLTIASQQNPARFGSLSSSYITTESMYNDQMVFFTFPFFDPNVLKQTSATKGLATLGVFLTLAPSPAPNYTNPLFLINGERDFIFCGGNCFQLAPGVIPPINIVEASKVLFPSVEKFDTFIPSNIGHAINVHFGASDVYSRIQSWIATNA